MQLHEGSIYTIIKDEATVINRCLAYGKKYGNFNFIAASGFLTFGRNNKRKRLLKYRRSIKVEILKIKNEAQVRQWKKVIEHIISNTCYRTSKCYTDRFGIVTYYLDVDWKRFAVNWRESGDYVVPPPPIELEREIE